MKLNKRSLGILFLVILILIGLGVIKQHYFPYKLKYNHEKSNNSYSNYYTSTISKSEAAALAQMEIETKLKSPSTAKFSGYGNTSVIDIENGYRVSGYVDSQNSFGATVRSYYTIDIVSIDGEIYYKNLDIY